MDPRRWDRIQRLFREALELPEDRRRAFLSEVCADAPDIASEVLALVAEDQSGDSVLDRGMEYFAGAVLDEPEGVPPTIGPYRLKSLLGEGGMGVVYLAEREDLESRAAIKLLRDAKLSPHRRERFLQEERFLARLSHPSIARLYDAGTLSDGTPYFVMEYVDGLPLTTFCERHGLSLSRRLELFREVCEAVQYAHRQALIHRDLKPSNILVQRAPDGEGASVKLLDFGIAKHADPVEKQPTLTKTGFGIMTPAYAAPEQLRGEPIGVWTDVYSLGVVLYELLTGALPFDLSTQSPFDAANTIVSGDPEKPSARVRRTREAAPAFTAGVGRREWADLDVLCLTAMNRDPARRYAAVDSLLRDIDHYLEGEPLEARPDSAGYRLGKFVRRRRRAVATGIVIAAAIVSLVVFYTVRLSRARDAALAEAARTKRIQHFMLDLFKGGDEVVGPEEGLLVSTLIERGVHQAQALDGDPAIQAELYQTLGEVYHRLHEHDRADELLQLALDQRRALLGNDHPEVAQTMMELGLVRGSRGELEEAERLARAALEMSRTGLPPGHPGIAEASSSLGEVLLRRGDHDAAMEQLLEAKRLQEAIGDNPGLMITLGHLADTYHAQGEYGASDEINRTLLGLVEERLGRSHPSYATVLMNLAASRRWLSYLDEAEELYREALVINEAYHGREHPTVASNLSLLGATLTDGERYDEALVFLEEALAIREAVLGPEHYQVALTLNQLARNQMGRKDLDAAEASFARELEIYRATLDQDHPWIATALSNLATIHFRRERYDLAEEAMRQSLAVYVAALKPDHIDVAIARIKLGGLLSHRERYDDAVRELTAGYEILTAQANPSMSWIEHAREELIACLAALGETDRADELRAEAAGIAEE